MLRREKETQQFETPNVSMIMCKRSIHIEPAHRLDYPSSLRRSLRGQLASLPAASSLHLLLGLLDRGLRLVAAAAVQERQVAVPAQRDDVDDKHAQVGGHVLEVDELHPRPDHEVLGQTGHVGLRQAVAHAAALEVSHAGEEEACEFNVSANCPIECGLEGNERVNAPMFTGAKTS